MKILGELNAPKAICNNSKNLCEKILKNNTDLKLCSFYIADLDYVFQRISLWKRHLTNIRPSFPVKYNSDPELLKILAKNNFVFGVRSKKEMESMRSCTLSDNGMHLSTPCTLNSTLKYAAANGIQTLVFDNENELKKIKKIHPTAKVLLRLSTNDGSVWGTDAHGANRSNWLNLIVTCSELGLNLSGVAFDGCHTGKQFFDSISDAHNVFQLAKQHNMTMTTVNIGSIPAEGCIATLAEEITGAFGHFFTEFPLLDIVADGGKFVAESAYTLVTRVTYITVNDGVPRYVINDGVYNSFGSILNNQNNNPSKGLIPDIIPAFSPSTEMEPKLSSICGSSVTDNDSFDDSFELIVDDILLPALYKDDVLIWHNMGNIVANNPIIRHQASPHILKCLKTKSLCEARICQEIEVEC